MQPIAMHPHLVVAVLDRGHLDGIDIPAQDARTALVAAAEAPPVTFATLLGFRDTPARGYVERIAAAVWADRRTILGTEDVKAPDATTDAQAEPDATTEAETDPGTVPRPGCRCALCLATPEQRRRITEDMAAQLTRAIRRNPLLFPPPPQAPRTLFPFDLY